MMGATLVAKKKAILSNRHEKIIFGTTNQVLRQKFFSRGDGKGRLKNSLINLKENCKRPSGKFAVFFTAFVPVSSIPYCLLSLIGMSQF